MGAASAGVPAIFVPAGAMLRGHWRNHLLGTGTSTWIAEDDYRAGRLSEAEWREFGQASVRSTGTCNTMGTASTMTLLVEVLGLTLPGASSIPAVDAEHGRMASTAGRRIVEMIWEDLTPQRIVTPASLKNAIVTDMALSGSTNSFIHLIAMARRLNLALSLDDFGAASESVPVVCNLMPAGAYLMEDFHFAGGLRGLLSVIKDSLDTRSTDLHRAHLGEEIKDARVWNSDVIRPLDKPIYPYRGAGGAQRLASATGRHSQAFSGESRIFCLTLARRLFFATMPISRRGSMIRICRSLADSVLVLQDAGPIGAPGMPEWGMLPIPQKLLAQGVRDMVRISDARMSGTSFGTCILHVCPESRVGGPLALVCDGDLIRLDTESRSLDLLVEPEELEVRRAAWRPPAPHYTRGYGELFSQHVTQADEGCDFDFLARPGPTPDPMVH